MEFERFDDLVGKKVRFVKGDYKGKEGVIVEISGWGGCGVIAKIYVDDKVLEFPADFWEEI